MRKRAYFIILTILLSLTLAFTSCTKRIPAPEPTTTYRIHTEAQAAYLQGGTDDISYYADGTEEKSRPLPVILDFTALSDDYIEAELSESIAFDEVYRYEIQGKTARIYNLKVGTTYYYRAKKSSGETSDIRAFRTEETCPRNLYIDGVTNARDLGGYQTESGRVRQGLLFRTARLNKNSVDTPVATITEKGIKTMLEELKVKTEIDLRKTSTNEIGGLTASVLGSTVNYVNCPMTYNADMLSANDESLLKFFKLLADESNYPIFFHCSIGTDRTGFCAYLLLTLLGVKQEEVYRDYLFSNFGSIGGDRGLTNVGGFALFIAIQEGSTQAQKVENYLLSIGAKQQEIDAFKRIMIE